MLPADDQAFIVKVDNSQSQIAWTHEGLSRPKTTDGIPVVQECSSPVVVPYCYSMRNDILAG